MEMLENFLDKYGSTLLTCAVLFVVGTILIRILMTIIVKALKRSKIDVTVHKFLISISKIILYVLLIVIILDTWGVKMSSIIAVFSVCGLAISLAVQDSLANVAGGMIILFSKPFELGDYVKIDSVEGTVIHINILHTKLTTFDNKAIYIPNGQVSGDKIINYTREANRRLDLTFSISYENDFREAKRIISEIIEAHPMALKDPAPLVRVCEFADSSINIAVKVWTKSSDYWPLNFDLLEQVKLKFDENGITIPYNQMEVTFKNPQN